MVCGDVRRTYAELDERANRLAHWMADQGVAPGQHVGLYLTNGTEYFEAMLACYKIRAVPINVNYRYVAGELRHLFDDADLVGVLRAARVRRCAWPRWRPTCPSWGGASSWATAYEAALAAARRPRSTSARAAATTTT